MATETVRVEIKDLSEDFIATANLSTFKGETMFLRSAVLPILEEGMFIYIYTYNQYDGVSKYRGRVDLSISNQLKVVDVILLETYQRRQNIKIKSDFSSYIEYFVTTNGERIKLPNPIPIVIKDISIGGIFIECDEPLGDKQKFVFTFSEEIIPVEVVTEILRTQNTSQEYKYGYGCKFIEPTQRQEDLINKYIVRVQMEEVRKAKK